MAGSSKSNNVHHIRSISLPSRSHPTTLHIEEELKKLKTWEASVMPAADKISSGLASLEKAYRFIDDLLSLPLTQQALSHHQNEKWVNELLDQSIKLLDVFGSTRDVISQVKEQVLGLQSALRRRKGDLSVENSIAKFTSFRKKTKKNAKRLIAALKKIDSRFDASPLLDIQSHVLSVVRVLREVGAMSVSLFQSLLVFLCMPASNQKATKWSTVSKLIFKEATTCEDHSQISNELESLECHIEGTENGLDSIFRSLIKTRISLLNVLSH